MFPFRDNIPARAYPLVTHFLIWINILIFLYELSLGKNLVPFMGSYGLVPGTLTGDVPPGPAGVILPFFISMFLHGGWLHLLGNMWFLYLFGDNVEDRMGKGRFLWFYLLSGLVAAIVHVLFNPGDTTPVIGASGAVAGVLGAYLVLYPHARVASLIWLGFFITVVEIPAVTFLGFWFVLQLAAGLFAVPLAGAGAGVAWWAHVGGFAMGFIFARFLCKECAIDRHPVDPRPYYR